jgi:hypothetical protein
VKIAVITPTIGEVEKLERCQASVEAQVVPDGVEVEHIVVGDGVEGCLASGFTAIELPLRANDAGATPRAIGSAYALGQGADAIAFLDDDNEWEADHLAVALQYVAAGAEVIASARYLCEYDTGRIMRADTHESDGGNFADTNTVVLAGRAAQFATTWAWGAHESGADRVFWRRLRRSFDSTCAATRKPTVRYRTPWLVHYGDPQFTPPKPAKLVGTGDDGKRIAQRVTPTRLWRKDGAVWHCGGEMQEVKEPPAGCVVFGDVIAWELEELREGEQ